MKALKYLLVLMVINGLVNLQATAPHVSNLPENDTETVEAPYNKVNVIVGLEVVRKGVVKIVGIFPDVPTVTSKNDTEMIKAEVWLEGNKFYCGWPDAKYKMLKMAKGTKVPNEIALKLGRKKGFLLEVTSIKMASPPYEFKAIF